MHYSKQREAIRSYLKEQVNHPTAEVVYDALKKSMPNISLGTVYRNLTVLSDIGEINRIRLGDGAEHFDGITAPHYHFICNKCGRIIDLNIKSLEHINSLASIDFEGEIDGHFTYFYGLCPDCLKK